MNSITQIRETFGKLLGYALFAHIALVPLIGLIIGNPILMPSIFGGVLATIPFAILKTQGPNALYRQMASVSLVLFAALIVYQFRGHPFQIDMHMYFFAVLAIVAAFCDARVIIISAAVVAVHHIVLNFIVPTWVFPEGANFTRVILHAIILIFEVPSLVWLALKLDSAFQSAHDAQEAAKEEAQKAKKSAEEANTQKQAAEESLLVAKEKEEENKQLQLEAENQRNQQEMEKRQQREEMTTEFQLSILSRLDTMRDCVSMIENSSNNLQKTTVTADKKLSAVSNATVSMNSNVNTVAASIEEMSATAQEIAHQVSRTASVADQAANASLKGRQAIKELSNRSEDIKSVISMINDIADQTNLLALNATIEAARAGEAGKGFAVVANEVKNLANQSQNATEEIETLIKSITEASDDADAQNNEIVNIIKEVKQNSTGISAAVEEQSATTAETSRAAQATSQETESVSQTTQELASVVDEVRQASEATANAILIIQQENEELRTQADDFIIKISKM